MPFTINRTLLCVFVILQSCWLPSRWSSSTTLLQIPQDIVTLQLIVLQRFSIWLVANLDEQWWRCGVAINREEDCPTSRLSCRCSWSFDGCVVVETICKRFPSKPDWNEHGIYPVCWIMITILNTRSGMCFSFCICCGPRTWCVDCCWWWGNRVQYVLNKARIYINIDLYMLDAICPKKR